jgi:hypothetical protein
MNLKLFLCKLYVPAAFRRAKIDELFSVTAQAFGVSRAIMTDSRSINEQLADYAEFTKNLAEKALQIGESVDVVQRKLFDGAYDIGTSLRIELGVKNYSDFRIAARSIYRALKINLACDKNREVTITKCFFRRYYSGTICRLISSLDSGLIAGLSGGNKMLFEERMTENSPFCKARIQN